MKTTLLNKKVKVTEAAQGKILREFTGTIAAIGYYSNDIKSYHRGFDVLVLKADGTLESVASGNITILPD